MTRWIIEYNGPQRKIEVGGNSLEEAVYWYGQKTKRKSITVGLLVRVKETSTSKNKPWGYWSGERFLECMEGKF